MASTNAATVRPKSAWRREVRPKRPSNRRPSQTQIPSTRLKSGPNKTSKTPCTASAVTLAGSAFCRYSAQGSSQSMDPLAPLMLSNICAACWR